MAKQTRVDEPTAPQGWCFTDGQLHALEVRCNEVSKHGPTGAAYFMGSTSDTEGNFGVALVCVRDGITAKHFGDFRKLMAILSEEHA